MKKIRKPSAIPLYGTAAVWIIYALFLPLYKPSHFLYLIAVSILAYWGLSKQFPGTVTEVKEPEKPITTGNEEIDALLREGEKAIGEMDRIAANVKDSEVRGKILTLRNLTDRIFKDLIEDPDDAPQVKRFSNYFLPTTIKLLNAYDRMSSSDVEGGNSGSIVSGVENVLDTTIEAYRKQLDALFGNEALDIETDIKVLETMLKREGLSGKDF